LAVGGDIKHAYVPYSEAWGAEQHGAVSKLNITDDCSYHFTINIVFIITTQFQNTPHPGKSMTLLPHC
jgi:hypothetical protein